KRPALSQNVAAAVKNKAGKITANGPASAKERDDFVADFLIALHLAHTLSAATKVSVASERNEQVRRNLHVAFALIAFHRDQNRYPKKLNELAPKYLAQVPSDLFSGKVLLYRPADKGFLLYSVGPNGIDEDGRWHDDTPPGDDPNVRLPLPKLKK